MTADDDARARQKAEVILKVRAGLMTATEAAQALGVSRKTYYKWEGRALKGMIESLSERKAGRPPCPVDEEKEELKKQVESLQAQVRAQDSLLELRAALMADAKKNRRSTAE